MFLINIKKNLLNIFKIQIGNKIYHRIISKRQEENCKRESGIWCQLHLTYNKVNSWFCILEPPCKIKKSYLLSCLSEATSKTSSGTLPFIKIQMKSLNLSLLLHDLLLGGSSIDFPFPKPPLAMPLLINNPLNILWYNCYFSKPQ